jgi:hypothetical protein
VSRVVGEKPILFSAPMVRAILAGTKSQTRRVIRAPRGLGVGVYTEEGKVVEVVATDEDGDPADVEIRRPYDVGDRLWVKEAIRHIGDGLSVYIADGEPTKADAWPWKVKALPGMYCPRGLSRITLEITGVRVERLQAITEEDARAEGVSPIGEDIGCPCEGEDEEPGPHIPACSWSHEGIDPYAEPHRAAFAVLWDALNGKRAPWASSPWVWVVEFRRVEAS